MPGLKLLAEIGLDSSGFEAGLKRAEGMAHGVAEGIKSFVVQAIGVLTVEQAISKTVETAKELVETSKRLSIAPEQLQVMRQAAKDAGVELGDVGAGPVGQQVAGSGRGEVVKCQDESLIAAGYPSFAQRAAPILRVLVRGDKRARQVQD